MKWADQGVVTAWRDCVSKSRSGADLVCYGTDMGDILSLQVVWEGDLVGDLTVDAFEGVNANLVQGKPELLKKGRTRFLFEREDEKKISVVQISATQALSGGATAAVSCEYVAPPAPCGKPRYHSRRGEVCGVEAYLEGTGPECGAATYRQGRDSICGVENYLSRANPACGVAEYNRRRDQVCGPEAFHSCRSGSCGWHRCGPVKKCKAKKCEAAACGVRLWRECSHPNFGPKRYKTCRHESNGAESFKMCRNAKFGIETYTKCRHPKFGAKYNECEHPSFGIKECLD